MKNQNFQTVEQLCHICNNPQQPILNDFKICGRKQCRKVYCIKCTDQNFGDQIYSDERVDSLNDWICFSCQGMCNCKLCDFYHDESPQVVEIKNTTNRIPNTVSQNHSSEYLSHFRQQSHSPFQYSSQLHEYHFPQKNSRGIGKPKKKERALMGLKHEITKRMPPYLESIMKRKQIFKQFMVKNSKKSYQQLIQQCINKKEELKIERSYAASPVSNTQSLSNNKNGSNEFILYSPSHIPQTPSFIPLAQPSQSNGLRLSDILNEKLKQYEGEEDDLSLQLL